MAVRYQTAAGQRDDQPSVTLIEQAQDHIHGGQTGADDRNASIRGNLGQSRLVPRIGDVPGKAEVADGLAREGRRQVADAERDMIVGCRRSAPEGQSMAVAKPPDADYLDGSRLAIDPGCRRLAGGTQRVLEIAAVDAARHEGVSARRDRQAIDVVVEPPQP
jgi:hypothetical protein